METAAPASRTDELLAHLRDIAIRVIELLLEWDEDNNGAVDQAEFLKALPVLGMPTKRAEGKVLFKMLSGGAREVDHWVLFRKLVSAPGVDLEAAEANARTQLAIAKTKDRTAVASPFWQRETGGKAVNRHALRKRNIALQPWQRQHKGASGEFAGGLRSLSPTRGDGDVEEVNARQLQGVVLTTTASIEQQLLAALDQHLARVIELFRAWDDNGDGCIDKKEFRRGLKLFGLPATNEDMDELFDSFDDSGDGLIQFRELSRMIKRAAVKHSADSPGRLPAVGRRSPRGGARSSPRKAHSMKPYYVVPVLPEPQQPMPVRSPRRLSPTRNSSTSAISRAIHGQETHQQGLDIKGLRAADESYRHLRSRKNACSKLVGDRECGSSPKRMSKEDLLRDAGPDLSSKFKAIGMACSRTAPLVAQECLERALHVSPRGDPAIATSMCNLGALHLQLGSPRIAIRYLERAVKVDSIATPSVRARARLNLSFAYSQERHFHEGVDCARAAESLLHVEANSPSKGGEGENESDLGVLRAVALHQLAVCHEHLGQNSAALKGAGRALKLARSLLPHDDVLVTRLCDLEQSLAAAKVDGAVERPKTR